MKKQKVVESPKLGLIDPSKPTTLINIVLDEDVEKFLDKVSKLSNHTRSSVIQIILSVQCIVLEPLTKAKKSTRKE